MLNEEEENEDPKAIQQADVNEDLIMAGSKKLKTIYEKTNDNSEVHFMSSFK